jgi:hypothetical protein
MKAEDKLRLYWGKRDDDLMVYHPPGKGTRADARLIMGMLDNKRHVPTGPGDNSFEKDNEQQSYLDELDSRGYDITTIKFSIEPKKGNVDFVSQREDDDAL